MSINTVNVHVGANYEGIKSLVKHNKIHSFLEGSYVCLLYFPFSVLRHFENVDICLCGR